LAQFGDGGDGDGGDGFLMYCIYVARYAGILRVSGHVLWILVSPPLVLNWAVRKGWFPGRWRGGGSLGMGTGMGMGMIKGDMDVL